MRVTATLHLADFVTQVESHELSLPLIEAARRRVLDWFGCVMRGQAAFDAQAISTVARSQGGYGEASLLPLLPRFERTGIINAALVNGSSAHAFGLDDVHPAGPMSPGAAVVSAAFAVGERERASGLDVLAAIVAGYEVAGRILETAGPVHFHVYDPTATCGIFGATVAAGRLLGLSRRQLEHALGCAATQAGGLWAIMDESAMPNVLHAGRAAAAGVHVALLAARGFTGPLDVFESPRGFFAALGQSRDVSYLSSSLGTAPWAIEVTAIRSHACSNHAHGLLDCLLDCRRRLLDRTDSPQPPPPPRRVRAYCYDRAYEALAETPLRGTNSMRFHLPHLIALAWTKGRVDATDLTADSLTDPDLRALRERVEVHHDPDLDGRYPASRPARVEVELEGGETLSCRSEHPYGHYHNPMGDADFRAKFQRGLAASLAPHMVNELWERLGQLDALDDVSAITAPFKDDGWLLDDEAN